MSKLTVTRQFRDDFEMFADDRIATGVFLPEEIEGLRKLIRIDLTPGPDQLRGECEYLNSKGVAQPAVIDDEVERYRLWAAFFADECESIRKQRRNSAAGINERMKVAA